MIFYRIRYIDPQPETGSAHDERWAWATTQEDAKYTSVGLRAGGMQDIKITQIDIPTSKPELFQWLKENLMGKDPAGLLLPPEM